MCADTSSTLFYTIKKEKKEKREEKHDRLRRHDRPWPGRHDEEREIFWSAATWRRFSSGTVNHHRLHFSQASSFTHVLISLRQWRDIWHGERLKWIN
ncbi:MAG: hypothetical protein ACHQT8_06355, partial [Chlamydiales bacterium]